MQDLSQLRKFPINKIWGLILRFLFISLFQKLFPEDKFGILTCKFLFKKTKRQSKIFPALITNGLKFYLKENYLALNFSNFGMIACKFCWMSLWFVGYLNFFEVIFQISKSIIHIHSPTWIKNWAKIKSFLQKGSLEMRKKISSNLANIFKLNFRREDKRWWIFEIRITNTTKYPKKNYFWSFDFQLIIKEFF